MRRLAIAAVVALTACGGRQPATEPVPETTPAAPAAPATPAARPPAARPADAARIREQDREVARLRGQLAERDQRIEALQRRLDEAINEVVRAMARLRTLATRAEAASAMAEADVVVQQLRSRSPRSAELRQADQLMQQGSAELDAGNYAGAVYLANQAKRIATPNGVSRPR